MFFIFIRACRKYGFTYSITAINGFRLDLHPHNTFEKIEVKQEYYRRNYFKLFLTAIKEMKRYRKERGY